MAIDIEPDETDLTNVPPKIRPRISIRDLLGLVLIIALGIGLVVSQVRLHKAEHDLSALRIETGYLTASDPGQIAAARAPSDQPLTYRVRVRVPEAPKFRVAYSSLWKKDSLQPMWFAAVDLPPGESLVTVRVLEDPRDERWKIITMVQSSRGTKRMATSLPEKHVRIFRGSHDSISMGISRQTTKVAKNDSIRLLDERWVVGEGGLLLYGDKAPQRDQIGIYAELQPDVGPL